MPWQLSGSYRNDPVYHKIEAELAKSSVVYEWKQCPDNVKALKKCKHLVGGWYIVCVVLLSQTTTPIRTDWKLFPKSHTCVESVANSGASFYSVIPQFLSARCQARCSTYHTERWSFDNVTGHRIGRTLPEDWVLLSQQKTSLWS